MPAKRSKSSKTTSGGRVTPKGTRPAKKAATSKDDKPQFSVRHAKRDAQVGGHRPVLSRAPTAAPRAQRGQR